jgi:hypothetical protein
VFPGQSVCLPTWVSHRGDSVAIGSFHGQAARARIGGDGRLLGYDARGTVVKVVATRIPDLDVVEIARQFAARTRRDATGPVSPRHRSRQVPVVPPDGGLRSTEQARP